MAANKINDRIMFTGQITEVFYPMGTYDFDGISNRKFLRAPFQLIMIQGAPDAAYDQYLMPTTFGDYEADAQLYASDTFDDTAQMGREDFGYHTLDGPVVVDESAMGNWTANYDSWMGMHEFGLF